MDIVLIDLFAGMGGFHLGLENAGYNITHSYFSEIDLHAIANYKYNFPNAEYIGSVTDVRGATIRERHPEAKIFITFGFPCQDLSIAGKRKGFTGARSSLFYHAARVMRESQSDMFIWENVQGLLSSNSGDDINSVFEELYLSGYLFDIEEINSSWIIPQNRVRLYSVGFNIQYIYKCLNEASGQNQNYNTCVKIIEGTLLTMYPEYLTEVLKVSEQKRKDLELGYLKTQKQNQYSGQALNLKFCEIIKTLQLSQLLTLSQDIQLLLSKQNDLSVSTLTQKSQNKHLTDIKLSNGDHKTEKEKLFTSIDIMLSNILEDNLYQVSRCIISILEKQTTISKIFSYAEMLRSIETFTIHLSLLYPNCWNEALLNLIEKKKSINYAKQNRRDKEKPLQKDDNNAIQLSLATGEDNDIAGCSRTRGIKRILPITENDIGSNEGPIDTTNVRTITGGGHSGGMHSSMTLLRVSATEEK